MKNQITQQTTQQQPLKYITDQNSLWYGMVKFKPTFPHCKAVKMITRKQQNILIEKYWNLDKNIDYKKWQYLFFQMNQVHCDDINTNFSEKNNILKIISMPKFIRLTHIYVMKNMITNIEQLSFFNAPCLEEINIGDNQISQIKSLSKIMLINLKKIKMKSNPILQINLSRIRFNQGSFEIIQFGSSSKLNEDKNKDPEDKKHFDYLERDISKLAKIQKTCFNGKSLKNSMEFIHHHRPIDYQRNLFRRAFQTNMPPHVPTIIPTRIKLINQKNKFIPQIRQDKMKQSIMRLFNLPEQIHAIWRNNIPLITNLYQQDNIRYNQIIQFP